VEPLSMVKKERLCSASFVMNRFSSAIWLVNL
jgi:hypothetical protein